ncbi:tRNA (adenosine(37)-N6)-threonylcarbamoyltransferase complex dimerization subunit type 1 TsaB [Deinococcus sonorensis]|uniref:tRNA (Adenosine(37)-N6)-threonylcarbamoyltransferase complex dimerization subunit type 1 TsaB n=2 Tax=Deinococcus sonorensis TaxID=309891 RepID=A0AAU7UA72_9DEIO
MPDDRLTLALDTATPHLSLALLGPDVALSRVVEVGRAHAERLPQEVQALFQEAGLPLRAGRIVVGTGPGSYTGLRVGASYALGLGRAWTVPVLGVSSLEALGDMQEGELAVSMDARKGQVYGAIYRLQQGVVSQTLLPDGKYPLAEFEAHVDGRPWTRDQAPDPLRLARAGVQHGQPDWTLSYL